MQHCKTILESEAVEKLPFKNKIISCSDDAVIIRSNLSGEEDIRNWTKAFSAMTNTKWNVLKSFPNGKAMVCRFQYVCHHTAYRKVDKDKNKRGLSKNTGCQARLNFKIKMSTRDTRKKDSYVKEGFCAIITASLVHNHTLHTTEALHFLDADEEVRKKFEEYFTNGMSVAESKKYHEGFLELVGVSVKDLVNARINPNYRTVQHWQYQWRKLNYSCLRFGPALFEKLREQRDVFAKQNVYIAFTENPFAVVLLTPLMRRSHHTAPAKEVVFCDSTTSCDAEQHTITFLLTPCLAGVTPLGIIITKWQTEESYITGFQLLKDSLLELGVDAFGYQAYPDIFITGYNEAKISALKTVWPNSDYLLSSFHILQEVWRWLCDSKNKVFNNERQGLMNSFKDILNSDLESIAAKYKTACLKTANQAWLPYMKKYWLCKEKWAIAYRVGYYTNNFSDICVRIFVDNVLSRVPAHNVIALVDFCCNPLEQFYIRKFNDFSRNANSDVFFSNALLKRDYIQKEDIAQVNEHTFIVTSKTQNGKITYTVDTDIGVCTCTVGKLGLFCKHEAGVFKHFNTQCNNFPPLAETHRCQITFLATGDEGESKHQRNNLNSPNVVIQEIFNIQYDEEVDDPFVDCLISPEVENGKIKNDDPSMIDLKETKLKDQLMTDVLDLLHFKLLTIDFKYEELMRFKHVLEEVRTVKQLSTFLHTAGSSSIPL